MAGGNQSREQPSPFLPVLALIGLFVVCVSAAPLGLVLLGPIWGVFAVVLAFALWYIVGPPPMPGFVPGILGLTVLLINTASVIIALAQWLFHRAA